MMQRSALLGTAGILVLAVMGHVVVSGLAPQQQAAAEGEPSRFSAPASSLPLQPMPARFDADPQATLASEARLVSGEDDSARSSRRRSIAPPDAAASQSAAPSTTAIKGLPSSLDEALDRFRENPVPIAPQPSVDLEPGPAKPAPTPAASPSAASPQANAPYANVAEKPAAAGVNPYRYQPSSDAPAANGAASIGGSSIEGSAIGGSVGATPAQPPQAAAPMPSAAPTSPPSAAPANAAAAPSAETAPTNTPAPSSFPRQTLSTTEPAAPPAASSPSELPSGKLFTLNSPAIVIETEGPQSLVLGKPATYRIHAKNVGDADARQISARVTLPPGIEIQNVRGSLGSPRQGAISGGATMVQWDMATLPARSEGHLDLELTATNTRPFELGVDIVYADTRGVAPISVLEPKLQMAIEGPQDILFGDTQLFKVIAKNTGTGPADHVSITIMPIKKGQNPTVIDSIGTIAAGDQKVIELELTAKQAGTLQLRAETSADNGLMAQAAHDVLVRRAELAVTAQGPGIKYAATTAAYDLAVTNSGNAPAQNIQIEAQLPTGAKFVSASDGGKLDESTNRVTWNLASLEAGATHSLKVVGELLVEGNNIVQVTANADQGLTSQHELVTRVESVADLKLLVNDPAGPIPVGQEVEYEFRLNNRGTKEAQGVEVTVSFGDGIQPVSVVGGKGSVQGDQVHFSSLPIVGAGQEVVVKVKARGVSEGNHTFRAEVRCSDPSTRLAIEESTHFYGAAIQTASPQIGTSRPSEPAPLSPPSSFSRFQ